MFHWEKKDFVWVQTSRFSFRHQMQVVTSGYRSYKRVAAAIGCLRDTKLMRKESV